MKETPILFKPEMIRAIFDGRKTQTRRTNKLKEINREPGFYKSATLIEYDNSWIFWGPKPVSTNQANILYPDGGGIKCPYGRKGDLLWVREAWNRSVDGCPDGIYYKTSNLLIYFDGSEPERARNEIVKYPKDGKVKPSIFMPKWACRLWLELTADPEPQRLHDIEEVEVEGFKGWDHIPVDGCTEGRLLRKEFAEYWDSINGAGSWTKNPWVWKLEFKRIERG